MATAPTPDELRKIDAYWRATNYLSVGQICLYDNPLLKIPLAKNTSSPDCSDTGVLPLASTSSMSISIG